MNAERSELNREKLIGYFRSGYPKLYERYERLRKYVEETLNNRKSHFIDIASPSMTYLRWNYDALEEQGARDVDVEQVASKMRAIKDYLTLLESDPEFFNGELLPDGSFHDIRNNANQKVIQADKTGERFDRAAYYIEQAKKRLGKEF